MRGITVLSLLNLALKNIFPMLIAAVIFGGGAFAYCEYVAEERYSATGSVLITNGGINVSDEDVLNGDYDKLQSTDMSASLNFMDTAIDMLKQNDIYKTLANRMGNSYSYNQLISMSDIERSSDKSLYLKITFTGSTQEEAISLVNEYMSIIPGYFEEQVNGVKASYFNVDSAVKVYPRTAAYVATAAIFGAGLIYIVFLIIFLMNTTIEGEDDFKERFDIPVIGVIPDFASARSQKYGKNYKKYGYYGYGKNGEKNAN